MCEVYYNKIFAKNLIFIGWVLIDRSGKHFGTILNYLRDGKVPMPDAKTELKELLIETKFYCLQELSNEV